MTTAAENIIDMVGGLTKMSRLLSTDGREFPVTTVQGWKVRGKIPQEHWLRIIDAAKSSGIEITLDMFLIAGEPAE